MTALRRQTSNKREKVDRRGRRAETMAIWALRLKGFCIPERRCKTPVGEIDLITVRFGLLVFAEVKARDDKTQAAWPISPRQQQRIGQAAEHYLSSRPQYRDHNIRFDTILVTPGRWPGILQ